MEVGALYILYQKTKVKLSHTANGFENSKIEKNKKIESCIELMGAAVSDWTILYYTHPHLRSSCSEGIKLLSCTYECDFFVWCGVWCESKNAMRLLKNVRYSSVFFDYLNVYCGRVACSYDVS